MPKKQHYATFENLKAIIQSKTYTNYYGLISLKYCSAAVSASCTLSRLEPTP